MPKFDLLPHPLRRLGRGLLDFFSLHQLASHGDHPFDKELYDRPTHEHQIGHAVMSGEMTSEQAYADFDRVFGGGMLPKSDGSMGGYRAPFS